ncbi:hypothetical protein C8R45DRAFT_1215916 [Mycena sanguinolenta]|nr:hypothetical protein C8R45DRAFT_1215916 [Mycena sanguinolenta]
MENDAPSSQNDVLARRTRTHEFKILSLEAEVAVLRLKIAHHVEDNTAVCAQRDEYKAERDRYKSERDELRRKYEGLKRTFAVTAPKRKYEPDADGEGLRDAAASGETRPKESPGEASWSLVTKSKLGEPIVRRASEPTLSANEPSANKRRLQTCPVLAAPSISLSASSIERTNDPRKRLKIDPTLSVDISFSTQPPSTSPPSVPGIVSCTSTSSSPISGTNVSPLSSTQPNIPQFSSLSSPSSGPPALSPSVNEDFQLNAHLKDKDAITQRFPVSLPIPHPNLPARPMIKHKANSETGGTRRPSCSGSGPGPIRDTPVRGRPNSSPYQVRRHVDSYRPESNSSPPHPRG